MESQMDTLQYLREINGEIIELNNLIDKKCLEIYNENETIENSIVNYIDMIENIILEHHKTCKNMFGKK